MASRMITRSAIVIAAAATLFGVIFNSASGVNHSAHILALYHGKSVAADSPGDQDPPGPVGLPTEPDDPSPPPPVES
jgi:hypothetical protein